MHLSPAGGLPRKQADALRYRLEGSVLQVDEGVYFLRRRTIPLDRITDLMLFQGPFLRHFGLWELRIQTAGAGSPGIPEAILIGLYTPEQTRLELLRAIIYVKMH